jgi:murein DD-endopeptidase MepM/ murein hydrolase activator NlpD
MLGHLRRSAALLTALALLPLRPSFAEVQAHTAKSSDPHAWSIRWQPLRLVNGSPVVFQVASLVRLQSLSGKWLDHDVFFFFDARNNNWFGIAGISLETRPGKYVLALEGKGQAGNTLSWQRSIVVGKASYRRIVISVPKRFTEPNPEQQQQIKDDQSLKRDVFSRTDPQKEWSGQFLAPVNAVVSDVFGTTRTVNGQTQSVHQGLDYGVSQGTPVAALNRGKVLLARPLFLEGNCIVLDHGQGLLTIYMHLSKFEVKEGDEVSRGQEIALSGGTGLATGPHLHVAVRWQGIYLNPATLLSLKLP